MNRYITPMVLAATVGMCAAARSVQRTVLISDAPIIPAAADELRLPVETDDLEDTVNSLRTLLKSWNLPDCVESDIAVYASRFHELVDKEFLGTLTLEESQELEVLTQWRDDQKNAFYQSVAQE